jgi:integrase
MATITFYPYQKIGKSKIYLRIRSGILDIRQSTLLTIDDATKWDFTRQKSKGKTASIKNLNNRLNNLYELIEKEIDGVEKDSEKGSRDINGKWLKQIILKFNNEQPITDNELLTVFAENFVNSLSKKTYKRNDVQYSYSENTIKKYSNFLRQLKEYEKYKRTTFKINNVDTSFAYSFLEYLGDEKGLSVNTKGRYIKRLKTIVRDAEINGIKVNTKYNQIKGFEGENIVTFLAFDELEKIIAAKMPTKRLEIARDWLIIASYTAQRISDLFRLREENIKTIDDGRYIAFKQFKTGQYVEVPIHYHVENILQRHGGTFPPMFSANEQSNRSMLSTMIKEACKTAKIDEIVKGRLNGKVDNYPKYKLISNHSGRRSFASNFHGLPNWSNALIMEITGHLNERNFYKYIDERDMTKSRTARGLFDQMKIDSEKIVEPELTVIRNSK